MKGPALLITRIIGSLVGIWGLATLWVTFSGFTAALKRGTAAQVSVATLVAYLAAIAGSLLVCWAVWRRLTRPIVNGLSFFVALILWLTLREQKGLFHTLADMHPALPLFATPLLSLAIAGLLGSWLKHSLFRPTSTAEANTPSQPITPVE